MNSHEVGRYDHDEVCLSQSRSLCLSHAAEWDDELFNGYSEGVQLTLFLSSSLLSHSLSLSHTHTHTHTHNEHIAT